MHRGVADFAVTRCSPEFLAKHGEVFSSIEVDANDPGSVRIASRLHQLGLLAEAVRSRLVEYWQRQAIDWLDLEIVTNPEIRGLMRPGELEAFLDRVRGEVVSSLSSYVDIAEEVFDGTESPDDVVGRLRFALETLLDTYPHDPEVEEAVGAANDELSHIQRRLNEDWRGDPADFDDDDWRDRGSTSRPADVGMFSDVDE